MGRSDQMPFGSGPQPGSACPCSQVCSAIEVSKLICSLCCRLYIRAPSDFVPPV